MPFIRRIRQGVSETLFASSDVQHEFYVKARELVKGDVIIPPAELPDEILRDLAQSHPKEFAKFALERGLLTLEDDEDDELPLDGVDDEEDAETFTEAQEKFMALNAEKAIEAIAAARDDAELLAEYAEAESAKAQPRKSVLAALQKAIES